jgi:hypothetical protein
MIVQPIPLSPIDVLAPRGNAPAHDLSCIRAYFSASEVSLNFWIRLPVSTSAV